MWECCNDKKQNMVSYLLSLPEIHDAKMHDGTTAFSMALGRKDIEMIRTFLDAKHTSDIDPIALTKRALLELDRDDEGDPILKEMLTQNLKEQNVSLPKECQPKGKISKE